MIDVKQDFDSAVGDVELEMDFILAEIVYCIIYLISVDRRFHFLVLFWIWYLAFIFSY